MQRNPIRSSAHLVLPFLFIALAVVGLSLRRCAPPPQRADAGRPAPVTDAPVRYEFFVFDTAAIISVYAPESAADPAVERVTRELRAIHDTINVFDENSEISRLNAGAAAEPFACSDRLWAILEESRRAYRETGGIFDISVGPLLRLWGIHRKRETLPSEEDVAAALDIIGLDKVQFDDEARTVRFPRQGMYLDFGGIAKGYGLAVVKKILQEGGIRCALIDLGGNIGCLDVPPPGRESFVIGVRNPFETSGMVGALELRGRCIATSGNYERQVLIQGRKIGHIIDPRTGNPAKAFDSVTVVTPNPVDSDIFSTAIFAGGENLMNRFLEEHPGSGVIRIAHRENGEPDIRTFGNAEVLEVLPDGSIKPRTTAP